MHARIGMLRARSIGTSSACLIRHAKTRIGDVASWRAIDKTGPASGELLHSLLTSASS
jgi:hypothetical protein